MLSPSWKTGCREALENISTKWSLSCPWHHQQDWKRIVKGAAFPLCDPLCLKWCQAPPLGNSVLDGPVYLEHFFGKGVFYRRPGTQLWQCWALTLKWSEMQELGLRASSSLWAFSFLPGCTWRHSGSDPGIRWGPLLLSSGSTDFSAAET